MKRLERRWRAALRPRAPVLSFGKRSSEGQRALDHEALELTAVADVGGREIEVLLVDPLHLREEQRGHEPARAVLPTVHGDVVRDAGQLNLHGVVARADIELILREAVDTFVRVLADRAVLELCAALAGGRLDVAEELEATDLDEGVHDVGVHVVTEARANSARPGVGPLGRRSVLEHVVVARASTITGEKRVARRLAVRVHRPREAEAKARREALVEADLAEVALAALGWRGDLPVHFAARDATHHHPRAIAEI